MSKSVVSNAMHVVWSTKYRKQTMKGERATITRQLLHEKASQLGIEVRACAVMPDHVHMLITLPATMKLSEAVRQLKGYSSFMINRYGEVLHAGDATWARRYFATSTGHGAFKRVLNYVNNQSGE